MDRGPKTILGEGPPFDGSESDRWEGGRRGWNNPCQVTIFDPRLKAEGEGLHRNPEVQPRV